MESQSAFKRVHEDYASVMDDDSNGIRSFFDLVALNCFKFHNNRCLTPWALKLNRVMTQMQD